MNFWRRIRSLSPREGYDLWARSYHSEANPVKKMSDDFITENLPDLRGKAVLDAGCGTGKFCVLAADQGALFVKGIDLSPAMIEEAAKNCPSAKLECSDLSAAAIEPQQYDVIICALVLAHIEKHQPVLDKLINGLKKGGTIIITDFHPAQTKMKARRTFKDVRSGKIFEIAHTGHSIENYFQVLQPGVTVSVFKEPLYGDKPVIFGMAGIKQ